MSIALNGRIRDLEQAVLRLTEKVQLIEGNRKQEAKQAAEQNYIPEIPDGAVVPESTPLSGLISSGALRRGRPRKTQGE